jgi:hypothetical protein
MSERTFLIYVDYTAKTQVEVKAKDGEEAQAKVEAALIEKLNGPIDTFMITHMEVTD